MKATVDFALLCRRDIDQSNQWAVRWVRWATQDYLIGYVSHPNLLLLPHNHTTLREAVLIEN